MILHSKHVLIEGLNYKDMVGVVKPTLYIDEFSSKIGDDSNIVVLSFYVVREQVAIDLVNWFEKGYDFVLDADRSPGEVKLNRHLVYVEINRRTSIIEQIKELLEDLSTLTEFELLDWQITHKKTTINYDAEKLKELIDLSPHIYRVHHDEVLNNVRKAANLPIKSKEISKDDSELLTLQSQAGII